MVEKPVHLLHIFTLIDRCAFSLLLVTSQNMDGLRLPPQSGSVMKQYMLWQRKQVVNAHEFVLWKQMVQRRSTDQQFKRGMLIHQFSRQ